MEESNCECGSSDRQRSSAQITSILKANRSWADKMRANDPQFFSRLANVQAPEWLWIGCSDSRVPANQLIGLGPGEVFVQRNVGNLATHKDMNSMACIEYAVTSLKVKHVMVCGHYGCGAVKAALSLPCKTAGLVNLWINDIRDIRNTNADMLMKLADQPKRQWDTLVELNVVRQVFNVCTSPVVQAAWDAGQPLAIHGVVYDVADGLLHELTDPITCLDDVAHYQEHLKDDEEHPLSDLTKSLVTHIAFEGSGAT